MNQYLSFLVCRFDTYLLSKDIESVVSNLKDAYGGSLSETQLTDTLHQLIDIDSVATMHDISITEVLKYPVLIIRDAKYNDCSFDLYIHKYFITFYVDMIDRDMQIVIDSLTNLTSILDTISADDLFLRMFYSLPDTPNDTLWNILDKEAFPVMDYAVLNGQYLDTFERDDVNIDLNRIITPSNNQNASDVYIQTFAICEGNTIGGYRDNIEKYIELSKEEISRCFVI